MKHKDDRNVKEREGFRVSALHRTSCGLIMRIGMRQTHCNFQQVVSAQGCPLPTAQSLENTLKFSPNTFAVLIFLINGTYMAEQIKQD